MTNRLKTIEATPMDRLGSLGDRVRTLRREQDFTLNELADRSGVSRSALSKLENSKASPTYDVIQKIARGFGMRVGEFLGEPPPVLSAARRAVSRAGDGSFMEGNGYLFRRCCEELATKKMLPFWATINARSLAEAGGYVRHSGEECLLVVSGAIEFHTEHYVPVVLNGGDVIYIDSQMGHAVISVSDEPAEVFWITVDQ